MPIIFHLRSQIFHLRSQIGYLHLRSCGKSTRIFGSQVYDNVKESNKLQNWYGPLGTLEIKNICPYNSVVLISQFLMLIANNNNYTVQNSIPHMQAVIKWCGQLGIHMYTLIKSVVEISDIIWYAIHLLWRDLWRESSKSETDQRPVVIN